MMDIKGLFVWTLGSVIRVIQLISTLKNLFVSHFSIALIRTHWIQGKNRILAVTRITWITGFLFISCLDQFVYTSRNPVTMGLRANTSDKKINSKYIASPKIFRIILSPLFVSQDVVLLAFIS